MLGFDPLYLVLTGVIMFASWLVSNMLQRKFALYSRVPMNLTGQQVAERMLAENGIHDVEVTAVRGQLTDHYHPVRKTVNLSEAVYGARSVAAAAVAAHECGHAVQHAKEYPALKMRSALVPVVSLSSRMAGIVVMAGLVLLAISSIGTWVLGAGIVLFAFSTLFSLVTLPVEFDASRRALAWLERSGLTQREEHDMAKDALKWAAMTYVVGALASLGQLFYFIMIFMQARR